MNLTTGDIVILAVFIPLIVALYGVVFLWMRPRSQRILREYDRKYGPPPSEKRRDGSWPSPDARAKALGKERS